MVGRSDFGAVDPFDASDRHLWIKAEHLGRYLFAADYLRDIRPAVVVDAACGIGYGTAELAAAADIAIGIDASLAAVSETRRRFSGPGRRFLRADLETADLGMATGARSVDAVVSFETLEHLVWPEVVVASFAAAIPPGGCLICSVPSALHEARTRTLLPRNRRHRQLFTFDSLAKLLGRAGFEIEYRLGQACSTEILKRETELVRGGILDARLSDRDAFHSPDVIRWFARVLAFTRAPRTPRPRIR